MFASKSNHKKGIMCSTALNEYIYIQKTNISLLLHGQTQKHVLISVF